MSHKLPEIFAVIWNHANGSGSIHTANARDACLLASHINHLANMSVSNVRAIHVPEGTWAVRVLRKFDSPEDSCSGSNCSSNEEKTNG